MRRYRHLLAVVLGALSFSLAPLVLPKADRPIFYEYFWVVWFVMLIVGDSIASILGRRDQVGDEYTDTHFIVLHLNIGLRGAVLGWLIIHFLVQHLRS